MKESTIEKAICAFAKEHGISTLKLSGPNDRGKADRMFMKNGKAVFLEIKAPGKRPTALQVKFLKDIQKDGFHAAWCDNTPAGIYFLAENFLP